MSKGQAAPAVLFVCAHKTGHSQLAGHLARDSARRTHVPVRVASAGICPGDEVSETVIVSLAMERHPVAVWPLPDPASWDVDGTRPLCNHLSGRVAGLLRAM